MTDHQQAAHLRLGIPPTLLRPPVGGSEAVARERLTAPITAIGAGELAMVVAPAGSGKTTLLAQAYAGLQARGVAVAWLSITPLANEFNRFFLQLIGAVRSVRPGFAASIPAWLEGVSAAAHQELALKLALAFSEVSGSGDRLVLFLDDYHEVQLSVIHRTMAILLDHLPAEVSLVIGSRTEPPLQVGALRAGGRLLELGWEQLRFSRQEAEDFLRAARYTLTDDQVGALHSRTEGWAAGLQLARIDLHQRGDVAAAESFSGGYRSVGKYLLDAVLNRQPAALQDFLLETAFLDRLSGPLCDAVCRRHGSAGTLEELEQNNLFTFRLDDAGIWYRYHHLFVDFLQARLRQRDPGRIPELYLRASRWYGAEGCLAEAVDYALRGRAPERAAELLQPYGRALFRAGQFKELKLTLEQLPERVLRRSPELCVLHGWACAYAGEFELARVRAQDVQQAVAGRSDDDLFRAEAAVLLGTLGVIRSDEPTLAVLDRGLAARLETADSSVQSFVYVALAYASRARGRLEEARRLLDQAVAYAERGESPLVNMLARYNVAVLAWLAGVRGSSEHIARGALEVAEGRGWLESMGAAFIRVQLGVTLYEADRLEEARQQLDAAIEILRSTQAYGFLGVAVVIRATVHWARGDVERTRLDLEWAERIAESRQVERVRIRKVQLQARMALATGHTNYARRHLDQGHALIGAAADEVLPWPEQHEQFRLLDARLLLGEENWQAALDLADAAQASAARAQRNYTRLEGLILSVEALLALGRDEEAQGRLREALDRAAPEQLWRPFFYTGPHLAKLVAAWAASADPAATELQAVLAGSGRRPEPVAGETLQTRERQILELVARGLRNREIGARLFLSEETVKWYLKRMYKQLGVRNRTAALLRARERGLIQSSD
ncbi:Serine/threonine-protein kinase PknK [wastewater metagenome]|uniref:Serine/threonine-protein kinase PknK n=2 Tax=unclassified sequences TaxID=12908 RepID=A0A5B8RFT4_9ZZZZ|nr:LuxR C-terminal-related transcriptional regulator [Arhodomonas sp. KWT]QEA06708.1 serine/threonine-protein kinase PknK [uncultured organism]